MVKSLIIPDRTHLTPPHCQQDTSHSSSIYFRHPADDAWVWWLPQATPWDSCSHRVNCTPTNDCFPALGEMKGMCDWILKILCLIVIAYWRCNCMTIMEVSLSNFVWLHEVEDGNIEVGRELQSGLEKRNEWSRALVHCYIREVNRMGQMSWNFPLQWDQVIGRWKYRSRQGVPGPILTEILKHVHFS